MSDFSLSCTNQRKQRSSFFFHEAGDSSSRFNIVSPYIYNANNQLVYSPDDLNMRRKAEILKYKNQNQNNNNKKLSYAFLSKKVKKDKKCNNSNKPKPSSSSNVPMTTNGKIIQLFEDNNVPLYNYKDSSKQFTFQNIPYDNYKRLFDIFPLYNVITLNNESVKLMDLIILNPDDNEFRFNFTIPICIQYEADFVKIEDLNNDIVTAQVAIFSAILKVFYSDSLISSHNIQYRSLPVELDSDMVNSTNSVSLDFTNSKTGKIRFSQYIGNLILNNVTIQTVTQYVYTIILQPNIGYAEYQGDTSKDDAYRTNDIGSDIDNTNIINISNVSYRFITNFDNTDSDIFNSFENCELSVSDRNGIPITDNERSFTEFKVTTEIV